MAVPSQIEAAAALGSDEMVGVGVGGGGGLGLQSLLELTLLNAYFYPIPDFTAAVASPEASLLPSPAVHSLLPAWGPKAVP